jgi:hypothetical protein
MLEQLMYRLTKFHVVEPKEVVLLFRVKSVVAKALQLYLPVFQQLHCQPLKKAPGELPKLEINKEFVSFSF